MIETLNTTGSIKVKEIDMRWNKEIQQVEKISEDLLNERNEHCKTLEQVLLDCEYKSNIINIIFVGNLEEHF